MESTEKSLLKRSKNQQTQTREQNKLKPLVASSSECNSGHIGHIAKAQGLLCLSQTLSLVQ